MLTFHSWWSLWMIIVKHSGRKCSINCSPSFILLAVRLTLVCYICFQPIAHCIWQCLVSTNLFFPWSMKLRQIKRFWSEFDCKPSFHNMHKPRMEFWLVARQTSYVSLRVHAYASISDSVEWAGRYQWISLHLTV